MTITNYSLLDETKLHRDIEEQLGSQIFDKFSILSSTRSERQIEDAVSGEIFSGLKVISDPEWSPDEMAAAIGNGAPAWLPDGALVYADFINGQYWADGAERTASEILNLGTSNGGTQNTITTEGLDLHVWYNGAFIQPNSVSAKSGILSSLNSVMATGFTVFIEYAMNSDDRDNLDVGGLFCITDTINPFDATKALYLTASETVGNKNILLTNDYSTLSIETSPDDQPSKSTGTYKITVSFGRSLGGGLYRTSGSLDGSLPDAAGEDFIDQNYSPNANIGTALNISLFNAEGAFAGRIAAAIRKLVIFSTPKTEAQIQALTA